MTYRAGAVAGANPAKSPLPSVKLTGTSPVCAHCFGSSLLEAMHVWTHSLPVWVSSMYWSRRESEIWPKTYRPPVAAKTFTCPADGACAWALAVAAQSVTHARSLMVVLWSILSVPPQIPRNPLYQQAEQWDFRQRWSLAARADAPETPASIALRGHSTLESGPGRHEIMHPP